MRSPVFPACLAVLLMVGGVAFSDGWVDIYSDAGTQFNFDGTANPGSPFPPGDFPDVVIYDSDGGDQTADTGYEAGLSGVFVGNREVRVAFVGGTAAGNKTSIYVDEFTDSAVYSNDAATNSIMVMNYGKRPSWADVPGATGVDADAADLDLDLSVDIAFFLRVEFLDQDTSIDFEVSSGVDEASIVTGTYTANVLAANTPGYVFAPFNQFSNYGTLNWGDIDSISLILTSSDALDAEFSALGYYSPEPGTMALLGLGLAALARRRRRR